MLYIWKYLIGNIKLKNNGECSLMEKPLIVSQIDVGSNPTIHPKQKGRNAMTREEKWEEAFELASEIIRLLEEAYEAHCKEQ